MRKAHAALIAGVALTLSGCSANPSAVADSPKAAPVPGSPGADKRSGISDCRGVSDESVALSQQNDVRILSIHNVETTENNYQAYLNDSLEFDGLQATIMVCEGTAITSAGTEEPVHMEWTVDVEGQRYVRFRGY